MPSLLKDWMAPIRRAATRQRQPVLKELAQPSPTDSTLVARFRAAGPVPLGRTSTPELTGQATTESVARYTALGVGDVLTAVAPKRPRLRGLTIGRLVLLSANAGNIRVPTTLRSVPRFCGQWVRFWYPLMRRLSGAALLAASAATRWGIFHAGKDSANDPRYTVIPQRKRLREPSTKDPDAVAMGGGR